uniref:C-type lectin domain-containing protein n=1 Tax=Mola mola TaxID=94237 RepID=A0A3Q3WA92_MOLML
ACPLSHSCLFMNESAHMLGPEVYGQRCRSCREGWVSFQSSCYLLSTSTSTWSGAEEACQRLGAHLLVVNSLEELVRFGSACLSRASKRTSLCSLISRTTFQKQWRSGITTGSGWWSDTRGDSGPGWTEPTSIQHQPTQKLIWIQNLGLDHH